MPIEMVKGRAATFTRLTLPIRRLEMYAMPLGPDDYQLMPVVRSDAVLTPTIVIPSKPSPSGS